ncbi:MAG: hypothetical protein KDA60_22780 [Planctomycetales bacterium]|nr:hypothetical protein [Planctomycetales bacterium]
MTPYHEIFIPIFLLGCLIAGILSAFAGIKSGCLLPGLFLLVGVVIVWVAIFVGSDMGYRAWQSIPDPPDEAFSDASVLGALILGWLPGLMFCSLVFAVVRAVRTLAYRAEPEVSLGAGQLGTQATDSGNPFQSPHA